MKIINLYYLILLIQDFVLIVMAWNLSSTPVMMQEKVLSIGGIAAFTFFCLYILPENQRYLLMSATWSVPF